jgi:cobalamin biosynthesis protein CobT
MTTTNFVIANIKLLIEISEDGNYRIHEDRTHMDFHPCAYDDLPPIRKNEDGVNIMQNILEMVSSSNKIKWENDNDYVEDDEDYVEDDEDQYEEDEDEEDQDDQDEEYEDEEDDDSQETQSQEKEEEPRVYNFELRKPKQNSLTTTLKNSYVKNNITKKKYN